MDGKTVLKIGLIGAGGRMRGVTRRLIEKADERGISVVIAAVFDPDDVAHSALKSELSYDYRRCESEDDLVKTPEVDWVFIGSWNCFHARQIIEALEAGKDVFCEKPLATSLEDCLKIKEAVARTGRRFALGLVLRYSPHYQKISEELRNGSIGKLISFEFNETLDFNHGGYIFGNWRRDSQNAGSHILEKCCHDIDLANWLVGALPLSIAGFGGKNFFLPENEAFATALGNNSEGLPAYGVWPDPHRENPFDGKSDLLDNQVAILEYANGVRATFHSNCNTAIHERRFYLCGTEGTLRADLIKGEIELRRIGWEPDITRIDSIGGDSHGGGDSVMADALVSTLVEGTAPLASVNEGIYSAAVAFGIDRATSERTVVDLSSLWQQLDTDPASPLEYQDLSRPELA